MIACLDVHYHADHTPERAVAACLVFQEWPDPVPISTHAVTVPNISPYIPGSFYLRELPCLLQVLSQVTVPLTTLIIDGYAHLTPDLSPGLGAHLHAALPHKPNIIGVAKTRFTTAPSLELLRGQSTNPLYITALGLTAQAAAQHILSMHGPHRLPTLLKQVDHLARHHRPT